MFRGGPQRACSTTPSRFKYRSQMAATISGCNFSHSSGSKCSSNYSEVIRFTAARSRSCCGPTGRRYLWRYSASARRRSTAASCSASFFACLAFSSLAGSWTASSAAYAAVMLAGIKNSLPTRDDLERHLSSSVVAQFANACISSG